MCIRDRHRESTPSQVASECASENTSEDASEYVPEYMPEYVPEWQRTAACHSRIRHAAKHNSKA